MEANPHMTGVDGSGILDRLVSGLVEIFSGYSPWHGLYVGRVC